MAQQRGQLPAVMLGLGAAFDFHAGTLKRAPAWMRRKGLEWLRRLYCEPRRLLWRYVSSNMAFVCRTASDVLRWAGPGVPVPSPFQPTVTVTHGERSVMAMAKEMLDTPVMVSMPPAKLAALTRSAAAALLGREGKEKSRAAREEENCWKARRLAIPQALLVKALRLRTLRQRRKRVAPRLERSWRARESRCWRVSRRKIARRPKMVRT